MWVKLFATAGAELTAAACESNGRIWLADEVGVVYSNEAEGEGFRVLSNLGDRVNALALSRSVLWAATRSKGVYLSADGGISWQPKAVADRSVTAITFHEAQGVAVGEGGLVVQTDDAGETWHSTARATRENLYGVEIIDQDHAVAVGEDATVVVRGRASDCVNE